VATILIGAATGVAVTIYGVCAVTFMMAMYALERRHRAFVLGFALGCLLSSVYGFLARAWPFGVVEVVWSGVALRRYWNPTVR
jgi:hypothetical protein